jgi:hypothetical protein
VNNYPYKLFRPNMLKFLFSIKFAKYVSQASIFHMIFPTIKMAVLMEVMENVQYQTVINVDLEMNVMSVDKVII